MINILNKDATKHIFADHDLVISDPPYEMSGTELAGVLQNCNSSHFVLLCSMHQLVGLLAADTTLKLRFDFVWDFVAPKKSKSRYTPHYTHATGVYITKGRVKSAFKRDGYWPTVIRANKKKGVAYEKNHEGFIKIIEAFPNCESILDPFAGSGSVAFAAIECKKKQCTISDLLTSKHLQEVFSFF